MAHASAGASCALLSGARVQLQPLGGGAAVWYQRRVGAGGDNLGVFDALNRGQADFGLVPIENSTDGRVTDTLDMFARLPVRICGEVQLRIHHHLLGKCRRSEVKEVYSKPQALSQCRTWLARHLPDARTVEMASTTAAARLAVEKPGAAAIASRQAGINYGLDFIAEDIEDNRHNVTRFAVIGDRPPRRSGNDKTSLMFELPHQPGALADAMAIFKRNRLNLTWIESFPMPGTPNEYLFFVEFQGHPEEMRAKRALAASGQEDGAAGGPWGPIRPRSPSTSDAAGRCDAVTCDCCWRARMLPTVVLPGDHWMAHPRASATCRTLDGISVDC